MTPYQQAAGDEPLTPEEIEHALEHLLQLRAPHLDQFLDPARIVLTKLKRDIDA